MESRKAALDALIRQINSKLFFQNLAGFLLLDALLVLRFGPGSALVQVVATVQVLILAVFFNRNAKMLRSMLAPLEAMGETADLLSRQDVSPQALESLIGRLDDINVSHLDRRLQLPQSSAALEGLIRSINAMLERIDRGYQDQARFVSDVSHELRTPISVIQGYARLLNRWGKDDPAARQEAIDAISQESESMARMVEQLLFLVRGDNDTQRFLQEPLDLSALAEEVAREMALLETGRIVETDLPPMALCQGDPGLLKQALRVLTDNAVKYTPEGGRITISLTQKDGYARLSVADTGQGIPREELANVFRRFYRTDQSRARQTGGTGLGLPIADWIAHRHGGWMEVRSVPGVGSRFTLVVPEGPKDPAKSE